MACDSDGVLYGIFTSGYEGFSHYYNISKYSNGIWTILKSVTSFVSAETKIFIDNKNCVWVGLGDSIFRIVDKSAVQNMTRILNSNIRKFKDASIFNKYISGYEVFVDAEGNLWTIGNNYGLGIVKFKAGRWNQ
jgi:hypothetical protein